MRAIVAAIALVSAAALPAAAVPIVTDYTVTSGTFKGCDTCPVEAVSGTIQITYDPDVPAGDWYTFIVRLSLPGVGLPPGPYQLGGPPDLTFATGVTPGGFTSLDFIAPGTVHFDLSMDVCSNTSCREELDVVASSVPEPGTLLLVALGLSGLAAFGRVPSLR